MWMDNANYLQWLNSLKVGDTVAIDSGGWTTSYRMSTVSKITKLYFDVNGAKFRRKDGYQAGVSHHVRRIEQPSKEISDTILRGKLLTQINQFRFNDASLDTLKAVSAAITHPTP